MKIFLFCVADWYMEADDSSGHMGANEPQNDLCPRHRFQLTWAAAENIRQQVALQSVSKQPPLMWKWALTCCSSDWKFSLHCAPEEHALEFQESQLTSRQVLQACEAEEIEGDTGEGKVQYISGGSLGLGHCIC